MNQEMNSAAKKETFNVVLQELTKCYMNNKLFNDHKLAFKNHVILSLTSYFRPDPYP